ncbi:MAG: 2,3-bisphosphoglycerate-dependent phosphoglycerate mutase [Candidatus Aenigmarchaeota archaeon]|nr:2,3-bisphosphoglycerate-dependent phosphoglycerate mutase [Candidatus Aenigmarchaeota archaeon]
MPLLVLVRHGESEYNVQNRFSGEADLPLTEKGREQASHASKLLEGHRFDKAYTSNRQRAAETLQIILNGIRNPEIPVLKTGNLKERENGILGGVEKNEARRKYGPEKIKEWTKSFESGPPQGESGKDVMARILPLLNLQIIPDLDSGRNVIVVSHKQPVMCMVMCIERLKPENFGTIKIDNSAPLFYERINGGFRRKTG